MKQIGFRTRQKVCEITGKSTNLTKKKEGAGGRIIERKAREMGRGCTDTCETKCHSRYHMQREKLYSLNSGS